MILTRDFRTLLSMQGGMTKQKLRRLNGRRWKYPLSIERRYTTAIYRYFTKRWKEYMDMATKMLVPRMDAVEDLEPKPGEQGPALGGIVSIAEDLDKFNAKEMAAFAVIAVGEAFAEEESWVPQALEKWSREQVSLITKATNDMRDAVARRVRDGVKKGALGKDIAKTVLAEMPGISFRRARIIARDQASKLNAELSQRRMNEAGLSTYKWETAADERVRGRPGGKYPFANPSHWAMQGKICKWDDPTVFLNDSGEWEKRPANAVYLHPGQAIMCRCVALPNWNELENVKAAPGVEALKPVEPPKVVKKSWSKEEIAQALASGVKPDAMSTTYWYKLKKRAAASSATASAIASEKDILTLKNLDKKIEKEIKDYKFTDAEKLKVSENLTKLFENADFGMNVPRLDRDGNDVLDAIFSSYFKNQIETGTGKGLVNVERRKRASHELFGTSLKEMSPKDFEKYGFLMDKDMLKQARSGIADQYWAHRDGIQVRFKKDKVNVTFTTEDSLGSDLTPSRTRDPKITSISSWDVKRILNLQNLNSVVEATREIGNSYIELQYHGDLTLDMVESIYIPWRVREKIPATTIDKMRATGAKIFSTILEDGKEKLVEI